MEQAFAPGYDPALEIARASDEEKGSDVGYSEDWAAVPSDRSQHLRRKEQDLVDCIISGTEVGRYYLLIGSKVFFSAVLYSLPFILFFTGIRERNYDH